MRYPVSVLLFALALGSVSASCQTLSTRYGCEAPEVRAAFETALSQDELVKLTITQRKARSQQVLDTLIAKYPHDYLVRRQQFYVAEDPFGQDRDAAIAALRERWANEVKAHPDDPVALTMDAHAQADNNPQEAIRLLEAARAKAPDFPWASFELTGLYWQGKYEDEAKLKENLERFYTLCPAWVGATSYDNMIEGFKLRKDLPLVAKTAVALRADLAQQTSPKRVGDYQILWQREFLTRPPSEHDAERALIRQDLQRLEKQVPNGDAQWRLFLISGYEQAGASNEELTAMRRKAAQDFPHQAPAEYFESAQWSKQHSKPEGQKDAAAWKEYYAADIEHEKKRIAEYPDDPFLQRTQFFFTVQDDEYVSEADGLAAVDRYLKAMDLYGGAGILSAEPDALPKFLLAHGWNPERALELLKKTSAYREGGHSQEHWVANIAAADAKRFHGQVVSSDLKDLGLILRAAELAGQPEQVLKFRAAVEGPPPENEKDLTQYWMNRARFAVLDHYPQDALAYYQIALDDRTHPPEYSHGVLRDDLTAEFHGVWTKQGGTESAWAASHPPAAEKSADASQPGTTRAAASSAATPKKAAQAVAAKEEDWKKVTVKMPAFELSDFSGKQWRQPDLTGKIVVVVSWATWCGPCHLQDAMLQKFYEKVKDRKDLVVVSFNIDQNPGQVLPFMRRQKYTFPVLAASSYEQAQEYVPQTWVIGKQGKWLWVKGGYDETKTYPEFEKDLLNQIEKAKAER